MYKLACRYLLENKARTISTMLSIVLGVALIFGVGILNENMRNDIKRRILDSNGNGDVSITKDAGFSRNEFIYVSKLNGIKNLAQSYKFDTFVEGKDNKEYDVTIQGIDIYQDMNIRDFFIKEGGVFRSDTNIKRQALLSLAGAEKLGVSLYDDIEFYTESGKKTYKIVGILENEGAGTRSFKINIFVPLEILQNDMKVPGTVNAIDIDIDEQLYDSVSFGNIIIKEFGDSVIVNSSATDIKFEEKEISDIMIGFNIIIIVVFFTGCFIIYNTFSVVIIQRIKTIGMLKTLGMSDKQSFKMILNEGIILGIAGTIIGLIVGALFGQLLTFITHSDEGSNAFKTSNIEASSIIFPALAGIAMSVISVLVPAKKVSKYSALEALKLDEIRYTSRVGKKNKKINTSLVGLLIIIIDLVSVVFQKAFSDTSLLIIMILQIAMLFIGITLIIPEAIKFYSLITLGLFKHIFGLEGVLSIRNLVRNIKRTSVIVCSITISVMVIIGFNGIFESYRNSIGNFVDNSFNYEVYIEGGLGNMSNIDKKLSQIEEMPEVDICSVFRADTSKDDKSGLDSRILGVIPEKYQKIARFNLKEGSEEEAFEKLINEENTGVIGSYLSETNNIGIGDYYRFRLNGKTLKVKVVGICKSFTLDGRVVYINKKILDNIYKNNVVTAINIKVRNGVDIQTFIAKLREVFPNKNVHIYSVEEIKQDKKESIVQGTEIFDSINIVIILFAFFGLMNTLVMSIYERKKELGLIRSIGSSRKQIIKVVFLESLSMATLGIFFGIILSIIFVIGAVNGMAGISKLELETTYPVVFAIIMIFISMILAIIVSTYPAYIAGKNSIVEAIKGE